MKTAEKAGRLFFAVLGLAGLLLLILPRAGISVDMVLSGSMEPKIRTGGLVFTGTPEGKFLAFDDQTGEILYKFNVGSGIVGSPVTWEQDGEQYVAIVSGWGGAVPLWGGEVAKQIKDINQGGTVHVFKLHKSK